MLDELFNQGAYYDFPSFEVALFSLLLSFVLSTLIGLTYRFTYEDERFPRHFFQAIVLSSTVSSMVIMAVGNNLAAGFGIIGAIAIIRFRTLIRDPRNIIFIFASLSVGIATGVYGYAIAIAGTMIFCIVAILLYYSSFGPSHKLYYDIVFSVQEDDDADVMRGLLNQRNIFYRTTRFRRPASQDSYRYTFRITISDKVDQQELFKAISDLPGYTDVRMSPSDDVQL